MTRTAIVIGAGFGGLALAIRLQSAGVETTVVEARDKPGGRAYHWQKDGFTFDAGPTVITDPPCLEELWALSGQDMAADVDLMPVMPFYRLNWPDGTNFDYSNDEAALRAEIAKLHPADVEGYDRFLTYSKGVYEQGYVKLGTVAFLDFAAMIKAAPALMKYQAWRSVYSIVSSYVQDERLRQALSFHTLLVGGNPMTTSAIYALIHTIEKDGGVWFARGGTNKLVGGLARLFERLGGTLRLGDPVTKIDTAGDRATGVTTQSGWHGDADMVACNGDLMHSYRTLLADHPRGAKVAKGLSRKRWSPSLFVVHFGAKGIYPDVAHHSILFGPRYKGLLDDIYGGVVPEDFSLYLHHPSITDPGMAPSGHSTFYALAPVAHLGKAKADWDGEFGERFADAILGEVERRVAPGLRANLVTRFHYTPADFGRDLSAHLGSAFSLEPVLWQSAWFRAHNRDDVISNLYFVGAGTHPGAGIPGVVGSAKATAALMLE
ncbi:Phytoene desaturase (lycopene-forming) [Sphingopyxis fribergensis]|uniref:Phytoene dehydrogenase n=1 Tax=Sphingopyxis fribergensis TaxID=1515612 RepID=A0A0A7PHG6_9SPHN|nr:phytoene desaturase [Sphingopyxis fribergensis]AJA07387.1 Phytoene desaturase (lycopene-forming) [Sphingopyxis fribergensis]